MTPKTAKLFLAILCLSVLLTVGLVFHEVDREDTTNDQTETVTAPV